MRGETSMFLMAVQPSVFQSTRPMRGETGSSISLAGLAMPFQSTRPVRGETPAIHRGHSTEKFQSTRPVRGEIASGRR